MSFSQLITTMQENAASANLNATQSDNGSMNPDTSLVGCSQIALLSMNMEKNNPVGEFDVACTPIKMDAIQVESTPQSKQKRRKHRPKIIVEGTPKRTPKSAEEKNVQFKENSTGKRKYVRRKGINKTPTTPAEETIKDFTPESTKKSCKRTSFDRFAGTENATADKDSEVGDNINVSLLKEASKSSRGRRKSEESQPVKRKYIRKKTLSHEECIPTAEGTAASCDKEAQDPSQSNPTVAQPIEKTTKKRGRKKKTPNISYPTEATVEFSEALICGPNTGSRSNKKSKEESSTSGQNSNACINQRSDMMNIVHSHDTFTRQGDFCILLPVDTQVQNTSVKRMRYSRRNATNKSTEDIKMSSIFSPKSTSHETKPIVNCSFEDNKNKRDQTTGNEESSNTNGRNIIGVHHNNLSLYRTQIETASTSATTNLNGVKMTFSPQDARRLDYASSSDSSEYNSDYDKFIKFISRVRSWEEQISENAMDKSLDISDVDAITKQFKKLKIKTQENAV